MRRIYPAELLKQGWTWQVISGAKEPLRVLWTGPNGEQYTISALALVLEVED